MSNSPNRYIRFKMATLSAEVMLAMSIAANDGHIETLQLSLCCNIVFLSDDYTFFSWQKYLVFVAINIAGNCPEVSFRKSSYVALE